jgi:hypothetical protein
LKRNSQFYKEWFEKIIRGITGWADYPRKLHTIYKIKV